MRKRIIKIIQIYLICILSISLISCSKDIEVSEVNATEVNVETEKKDIKLKEEIIEISDEVKYISSVVKLDNGDIEAVTDDIDFDTKVYISHNNGETWEEKAINVPEIYGTRVRYVNPIKDGRILLADIIDEETAIQRIRYVLIDNDGSFTEIDKVFEEEINAEFGFNGSPIMFNSLSNGDLMYYSDNRNEVIQIDSRSFEEKRVYKCDSYIERFIVNEDYLIIKSAESILLYDINTGELIKGLDKLEDALDEENAESYSALINSESDNNLFFLQNEDIVTYNLDDEKITPVITDSKYLCDAGINGIKIIELSNNEFLYTFSNNITGQSFLVIYRCDGVDMKIEENEIVVFSLTENKNLNEAITRSNIKNKDINIKYEVALNDENGKTVSDAIKSLNAEIMAGKGPDIILLDNLPVDSYIENGILADISEVVNLNKDKSFVNIASEYKRDEKIYEIPLSISIPVFIGPKEVIEHINDMKSFLDVAKEESAKSDNRIVQSLGTPEEFIYSLYYGFGANWIDSDGVINKDTLTDFLENAKEIYNLCKVKEDIYKEENKVEDGIRVSLNSNSDIFMPEMNIREMTCSPDKPLLAYGQIGSRSDVYLLINMLLYQDNIDYKIITNESGNFFAPSTKISVNNKSKNKDNAIKAVKYLIDEINETEKITLNREAFINGLKIPNDSINEYVFDSDKNHYIKYIERDVDNNGVLIKTPQYWLNDEDINTFVDIIESLDVAPKVNLILVTEVANKFSKIIDNDLDINKAVSEIISDVEVYLLE
ncbi:MULTISPECIES: extracellular solute-binding protein [unclassified Clostridium]|uniref:extracellular solute-binding protein n=1 Tax=unclassified Clostridium TaxID=2614128 RepID=UPI001C8B478F|nr:MULTISPECIES: extracellular solute-binding protein [unclassified Clostridium]MBX9136792.1 extracellular solute-binding protein [Clostridium sp. K12(2020)]MBX9143602.1 extracellular solute-binding protein [Clostridium sp. K13]MDU2288899.1 extracellular solute-binding protein [Clostridium celatum]MDU4325921.1 extracellular solute-binding protein [Clostridium celatum]